MPVLMGKLDTSVNGPEGLPSFDGDAWDCVDWRHHEGQVRRLRGRIFKAVREGDWPSARSLQKLMLRSWSNTLVSVRQATQRNTGRRTAGIDELVALTSQARAEMAVQVHATIGSHQPSPVRRVYIPKAGDKAKMRPLGIPVLADRCHQGGVISPLLLNIALHGLEEAAGVRYRTGARAGEVRDGCPALTRYADDLVVCCHSRQQAERVQ